MTYAPIALFVYSRLAHTGKTVDALLRNPVAHLHDLIIFCDAARRPDQEGDVKNVREYVASIKGFKSVTIHHRLSNFGLAKSITAGVSQVLADHEAVIVVEDDIVTSPFFLSYMNEALDLFANEELVVSIHGYMFPIQQTLPEAFFLPGADCWGWATWRRGWKVFNPDGKSLLSELKRRNMLWRFDFNGTCEFSKMLEDQTKGLNDSWAVRWHASAYLAGKLTLHPGRSLVRNIGNDGTGTHGGTDSSHDTNLSSTPINLAGLSVEPSSVGHAAFEAFYRSNRPTLVRRLMQRIRNLAPS